jgi:antitoxin VapB
MTKSTLFITNRSQAVQLPKVVAFPEGVHQVDILKIGRSRVIVPQASGGTTCFGVACQRGFHDRPCAAGGRERERF